MKLLGPDGLFFPFCSPQLCRELLEELGDGRFDIEEISQAIPDEEKGPYQHVFLQVRSLLPLRSPTGQPEEEKEREQSYCCSIDKQTYMHEDVHG